MKHQALLPNIVTASALSCGLFVIFKMSMIAPGQASYSHVLACVFILLLACVLDLIDGAIARMMNVESKFGIAFDSLADAVSFGVAPSVVILKALSIEQGTPLSFFLMIGALIFSMCGILRLVRFTVTKYQVENEIEKAPVSKAFTGLPIPAGACIPLATTLFLMSDDASLIREFSLQQRATIASFVFFIVGYFMISRWKFPSLKSLHIRVTSFQLVLLTVVISSIVLFGALNHFALVLAAISWSYFLVSWVLSIVRVISGKRLKALEDFEPEIEQDDVGV